MNSTDNDEPELPGANGGAARDDLPARQDFGPTHDYWIVAGAFVMEPSLGGMLLGELPHYQLREGAKILEMTQAEFDELMEEFYNEEGYYPDT